MSRPKTTASEDRSEERARTGGPTPAGQGTSGSQGRRQKRRATTELVLAVLAAAGAVLSWFGAQATVTVAPILEGEPQTTSVVYSPPMLVLMLMLATVAGVLAVDGVARLRRAFSLPPPSPRNSIPGR